MNAVKLEGAVTPIYLLPAEILAAIFMELRSAYRLQSRAPVEVTLAQVCTHWRDVALGTPFLWTNINIYSPKSLNCVSSYLERSKGLPINVRFDLYDSDRTYFHFYGHGITAQISPLVDLVIKHVARWRILVVFAYFTSTSTAVLSKMRNLTAPLLQRIYVTDDEADDGQDSDFLEGSSPLEARILTLGTPHLSSLRTDNLYHLPQLSTLTALHLHVSSDSQRIVMNSRILSDLIIACPSLSTLSINGGTDGPWSINNMVMQSLRSLWFITGDTFAARFLSSISLPNLETLWLDGPHYQIIQDVSNSVIRPIFPSLRYLTLQSFDYYSSSLFAKIFPTVTCLHLSYCASFHISFLEQALKEDEYSRWRHLNTLVFRTTRDSHSGKFSRVLNNIVRARHNNGLDPIRTVLVDDDILGSLTTAESIREVTSLNILRSDNFHDPWWIMLHTDYGDRL